MAIEAKELMLGIEFEAFGLFAGVTDFTPDGGKRIMAYRFDYFGELKSGPGLLRPGFLC